MDHLKYIIIYVTIFIISFFDLLGSSKTEVACAMIFIIETVFQQLYW